MADQLATLVVAIAADAKQYMESLDRTAGKTQSWAGKIGGVATKALGGLVVGGAVAAAGAVAAIGGAALNVSRETEQATANIAASLGTTVEEAERFGAVAREVYGQNFAGSVTEAGAVVAEAFKTMGDLGDAQLSRVAQKAFALADNFDAGPTEAISAAQALMENFGVSSDQAFDLIAKGFQKGLNRGDDFIDTIEEYSTQFASGGASAEEFFSLLESGLAGGMLGTDKAADAFKEFRVRIQDGSDLTAKSLAMLGIDAETMASRMADGSLTAAAAFGQVVTALQNTEDSSTRMQAGVGLLGTQFEDLGDAALSLSLVGDQFADIEGAADSLNAKYQNFGDLWGALWRKSTVAVAPATDKLLELANDAMPYVEQAFDFLAEKIPPAIDWTVAAVEQGVEFIRNLFRGPLGEGIETGVSHFETVREWIDENMPLIRRTVETVLTAISRFWDEHGEKIMRVVRTFMGIVQTIIDTYLRSALDIVKAVMQLITGDLEGAGETIKGIFRRAFTAVFEVVGQYLGMVADLVRNIDWGALGRAIIQGIANGLSGAGHLLLSAALGAAQGALDGIKGLLGTHSPSAVMALEVGEPMAEGIGAGFQSAMHGVMAELSGVVGQTVAGLSAPQTAAGGSTTNATVTINIAAADREQARIGVLDALRSAGLA